MRTGWCYCSGLSVALDALALVLDVGALMVALSMAGAITVALSMAWHVAS